MTAQDAYDSIETQCSKINYTILGNPDTDIFQIGATILSEFEDPTVVDIIAQTDDPTKVVYAEPYTQSYTIQFAVFIKDFGRGGIEWTHQITFIVRDECLGAIYSNSQIEIASGIESLESFEYSAVEDLWIRKRIMRLPTQINLKMPTYQHYGSPDRENLCMGVIVVDGPTADPLGANDE